MTQIDIDYRTQPTAPRKDTYLKYTIHYGIYTTAYTLTALAIALYVMPRFLQVFRDFKTSLPAITEVSFRVSRTLQNFWVTLLAIFLMLITPFLLAAITVTMSNPDSRRRFSRAIIRSLSWLALLSGLWLCLSILLPLTRLMV